jgi:hypothetical protein
MTSLGLVFIPLCLLFWSRPSRLLDLVFIGSAFAAAAAIVIGSNGVTPGLIPTSMFIAYVLIKLLTGTRYPGEKTALGILLPFIAVSVWAIVSSILMPRFFQGQILVWPQKSTLVIFTPLAPNSGNYTQDLYLLAASILAVTAAIYLTNPGCNPLRLLYAYFAANLMVCFISLWQFAANTTGIWFPTNFFLSNPGWALLSQESIGSIIRITGPFSEPAALAGYLCGAVGAAGWVVLNGHKSVIARVVLVLSGIVVLLSTATTGYAALAIMIAGISVYTLFFGNNRLRASVGFMLLGLAAAILLFAAITPFIAPKIWHITQQIIDATLAKQGSTSYSERTSTDRDSLHEAVESYGLGVGWGSNRSSSLIPGLLAALGLPGVFLLLWLAMNVTRHVLRAHRLATAPEPKMVMHAATGGIFGTLSAAVLSSPSIVSPDFYLLLALLVATATRVTLEARQTRTASHAATSILAPPKMEIG